MGNVLATDGWKAPVFDKDPEVLQRLMNLLRYANNSAAKALFLDLPEEQLREICLAMSLRELSSGEKVIQQGEEGDCLYVVDSGKLEI